MILWGAQDPWIKKTRKFMLMQIKKKFSIVSVKALQILPLARNSGSLWCYGWWQQPGKWSSICFLLANFHHCLAFFQYVFTMEPPPPPHTPFSSNSMTPKGPLWFEIAIRKAKLNTTPGLSRPEKRADLFGSTVRWKGKRGGSYGSSAPVIPSFY